MNNETDEKLAEYSAAGNRQALEHLVNRYRDYFYNIALRMYFYPEDAKDLTQEALIKLITNISGFQDRSLFKTWAYKICINHIINFKKSKAEKLHASSFSEYWKEINSTEDFDFPDTSGTGTDTQTILDEIKTSCMSGMLLCLNRERRMVYILGGIFGLNDSMCADILDITKDNFRQKLSRARKSIKNFMAEKCGLIKPGNPCNCGHKAKFLIERGYIKPGNLRFCRNYTYSIEKISEKKLGEFDDFYEEKCR
jgi:RNA polymerase sigma factor (sigma-70 family)